MAGTGLWRTKSVEQSIADTDEPETKLRKELSAWDLTVFGVAVVIGAGIFTLTARTAGDLTGPSVSVAFVLAAIACALAARWGWAPVRGSVCHSVTPSSPRPCRSRAARTPTPTPPSASCSHGSSAGT